MEKNLKILCVDDSSVMRVVMKRCLLRLGHGDVVVVSDGESALANLKDGDFDLVLTDCCMPGMSGMDLLRAIRADASLRRIRVIMVSGNDGFALESEARKSGIDGFLPKPFPDEALDAMVKDLFEVRASLAA